MIQDFYLNYDYLVAISTANLGINDPEVENTFIWQFGLNDFSPGHEAIVSTYFAFTSLSTVGFGDYYPVSDAERLVGSFVLLFGVAIFSYIMGNFINILS